MTVKKIIGSKRRWFAYDFEIRKILKEYINPGLKLEEVTNPKFSKVRFKKELSLLLKAYCKRHSLKYNEIKNLDKPLVIDSRDNTYFSFLSYALTFYDPIKIPEFLSHQFQIFEGNSFATHNSFMGYLEFTVYESIRKNSPHDNYLRRAALMDWIRRYKQWIYSMTKTDLAIQIVSDCRNQLLNDLEEYFSKTDFLKLKELARGNPVEPYLYFNGEAGEFCEYIKRLFYNKKIKGVQTDLQEWILRYFAYYNTKTKEYTVFSPSRVEDFITKNKDEIPKKKRIGKDWLPFRTPSQRQQIK